MLNTIKDKRFKIFACIFSCIALTLPLIGFAHLPTESNGKTVPSLAPMLDKVMPAIVNIKIEKIVPKSYSLKESRALKKRSRKMLTEGSGVIINAKKGLIVTNAHVVENEHQIIVRLKNGRRYRAKLVSQDPGFDIAIIKINAQHLTNIQFGDSDELKVGDFVAAIGSPFGLSQSVTSGVISALNRSQPRIEGFQSFIQTDAPINPGNSGGALVNLEGKLIGINTAIFTPQEGNIGIGFAIPSNMVHSVIEQLLRHGKVSRGILGVIAQNLTTELASALGIKDVQGAVVTQIIPNSPAEKSGIKTEDIIKSVNNKTIKSATQLRNTLGLMPPSTKIKLTIIRQHKPIQISAVVGDPKTLKRKQQLPFLAGLRLQNFKELETDGHLLKGVIVAGVSDTSAGALAGLMVGDVITIANTKNISSVVKLESIVLNKPKHLFLKVERGNRSLFLVVQPS